MAKVFLLSWVHQPSPSILGRVCSSEAPETMETDSCLASPAIIDISDTPWHIWISFQWWLGESCSFILVKEQFFSPQFILDWYLCKIQWKELLEKWNKNEIKTKLIRRWQNAIHFPNTYSQCLSFSICRPVTQFAALHRPAEHSELKWFILWRQAKSRMFCLSS